MACAVKAITGIPLVESSPFNLRVASPLVLPLKNVATGATINGAVRGGGAMETGVGAMLIFRAGGMSHVFDPLFASPDETGFTKEFKLAVPPSGDLRMTMILTLEGSATDPQAQAVVNLDSVDLSIGPAQSGPKR